MITDSKLRSMARERSLSISLGGALEYTDENAALRPIAFAGGAYITGMPPQPDEPITFREVQPFQKWEEYAWDAYGHPTVFPLYSPWQILSPTLMRAGKAIVTMGPQTRAHRLASCRLS
jgi:hypothetical protein